MADLCPACGADALAHQEGCVVCRSCGWTACFDGGQPDLDYPENEARWADRRTRYLARAVGLREPVARTLAWRELGYSSSGIAGLVEVREDAVRRRLDELADRFGPEAVETRTGAFDVDLAPGDRGDR